MGQANHRRHTRCPSSLQVVAGGAGEAVAKERGEEGEGAAEGGNWWEGRPLVLVLFLEGDKEGQQLLSLLVVHGPCCHSRCRRSLCARCPSPTGPTATHPPTHHWLPFTFL